jgi:branched-chain amino acid aminotransferase
VQERVLTLDDLQGADEVFATGNFGKVQPVTRYEQRELGPGPIAARARELYWAFAHNAL